MGDPGPDFARHWELSGPGLSDVDRFELDLEAARAHCAWRIEATTMVRNLRTGALLTPTPPQQQRLRARVSLLVHTPVLRTAPTAHWHLLDPWVEHAEPTPGLTDDDVRLRALPPRDRGITLSVAPYRVGTGVGREPVRWHLDPTSWVQRILERWSAQAPRG